ncbi:MAG: UDP-N-acetylmuramate dehydrogenase [Clostridia bacterium]|nr:UDP-N-acetylmuramate dehydrogenase [Clostridia bacterium]MBQ9482125.1 UDP-N-acetylmuramate dehydrogenase [Clostridia bacterium]
MADLADLERELEKNGINFLRGERLSSRTTMGTGGGADVFALPSSVVELIKTAEITQNQGVKSFVLGGGSNVLAGDGGYRGCVISTRGVNEIYIERESGNEVFVRAFAGAALGTFTAYCIRAGLGGAEFLSGIPGTVGGAAVMNAGCFGRRAGDIISSVFAWNGGRLNAYRAEECSFGYRSSAFQRGAPLVISVLFRLKREPAEDIIKRTATFRALRESKQPAGRSMGSVFRNGETPAGKAIEACGLKGARVGGAYVSEKHANFIINDGSASSADVYDLIKTIKAVVRERTGITLTEEIKYAGEFG